MHTCPLSAFLPAPSHPNADACFNLEVEPGRLEDFDGFRRPHRISPFHFSHVTSLSVQGFEITFVFILCIFDALDLGFQTLLYPFGSFFSLRSKP